MSEDTMDGDESSLQRDTMALGTILRKIGTEDPASTPSAGASATFLTWLVEAGPASREPHYFADVAANFNPTEHSSKDLWNLFDLLAAYIDLEQDTFDEPKRTFIDLPLLKPSSSTH